MQIALPNRLAAILTRLHRSRFLQSASGLAALEFALILPMMLTLYIGGVEVNDAVSIKRKLNHATAAMADLVAQSSQNLSAASVADIFGAGKSIVEPYEKALLKATVIGVSMDANKKATVAWAQAFNGATCPAKGGTVSVPANLAVANGFLVMVDASYAFTPKIGYVLTGTFDMKDSILQQPRLGKAITGPTC
ncbi:Flp pilus assembly protein TadG [Kaistia soli DSM 19436]|uniref:Flp pilus assembly protein TadG n=1 Tax=Kaistia soli DSM 19436 TaxID=1122133 RepID=A0A1M5P359_9HYPH|nr:TadE/TadG family type IV pilus assembly protein [Kaistia soli]SHG96188.1 Flp pilus assembly protein TadG [Kaistia soli DSM 19436]